MSCAATLLTFAGQRWNADEVDLAGCESLGDLGDLLWDCAGEVRLLLIEEDDEYAAIVRVDGRSDEPRAFLTDGHAADSYSIAALIAEELDEIGAGGDEQALDEDAPAVHDSAPFGDAGIVEDLGMLGEELLILCARPGTLPGDVLAAVCDRAGCVDAFESVRA